MPQTIDLAEGHPHHLDHLLLARECDQQMVAVFDGVGVLQGFGSG
jgi:hypothetical protein